MISEKHEVTAQELHAMKALDQQNFTDCVKKRKKKNQDDKTKRGKKHRCQMICQNEAQKI